jgi:hypothetical protein
MKNLLLSIAGLVILAITAGTVNAQNPTANATADASANIIVPIAIAKVNGMDLKFGNIIADADGGTVAISTTGAPVLTGVNAPSIAGERQQAQFTVTGFAGATYAVTLPVSATLSSDGNNMTVNSFVSNPSSTGVLTGGSQALNVGATLNVGANQAPGLYTGNFSVTVVYN